MAVAKRALKAGETLDGEGGYTVYAKLISAAQSLQRGALPIGLAHHVKLTRDVAAGEILTAADVALDETEDAVRIRREMERDVLGRALTRAATPAAAPEPSAPIPAPPEAVPAAVQAAAAN